MEKEMLDLLLDMLNEENELIAEQDGNMHYISLNDLKDNNKEYIYINTNSEKVFYFNESNDIINKIKNLDLDFKEQKKGKDI
ncbi:hypothetical protein [Senegalia massiliensis]|uniref:hypothetical protein n=1 Tax=Senegalia massiliensis TaxID=1720316 RepID=UPI0010300AE5|nr:hypothetical protein [Senegalia massiliensis]